MMSKEIGRSMIDNRNRITLVGEIPNILRVKQGDYIIYEQHEDGAIYMKGYGLRKKPINNERDRNETHNSECD